MSPAGDMPDGAPQPLMPSSSVCNFGHAIAISLSIALSNLNEFVVEMDNSFMFANGKRGLSIFPLINMSAMLTPCLSSIHRWTLLRRRRAQESRNLWKNVPRRVPQSVPGINTEIVCSRHGDMTSRRELQCEMLGLRNSAWRRAGNAGSEGTWIYGNAGSFGSLICIRRRLGIREMCRNVCLLSGAAKYSNDLICCHWQTSPVIAAV